MAQVLRQSTQVVVVIGPFVDVGDGFTPETGVTLSGADEAEILKGNTTTTTDISGATWAAITGCDGWYGLTLTTAHTDTVGALTVMVNDDSVCLPVFARFQVIEEAAYDSFYAASADPKADINVATIDANAITAAAIATGAIDADAIADNAIDAGAIASGAITAAKFAAGAIDAAAIANGAIDAATFAADVDAEILSYIVDDATRIDASALNTAAATTVPAIVADTNELQTDWANGGRLDLILDARASQTSVDTIDGIVDSILLDTAEIGAAGAGLTALATQASVNTVDTVVDAIKAKTDSLAFTVAGQVDANVKSVTDITITGTGTAGDPWGP